MKQYRVKIINWANLKKITNTAEYFKEGNKAPVIFCNGFKEVCKICGGRPRRYRCGWGAMKGEIEFIIEEI